jgi:DNA polymerase-1
MKNMRQLAKSADFGFPGGLGAASFQSYARKAWDVVLTFEQARDLKHAWLNHFPEMAEYFDWMSDIVEAGDGRAAVQQFMTNRWRGKCFYTQSCNTMFQGLTADAAKAATFEISRLCYTVRSSALYGCRPLLMLHDEIITESPREQAPEAAVEKERVMIEVYQRYTPDIRITADAHLMDRWSKDAEAVHDERGKLIPWEPPQAEDERAEVF